LAKYEELLQKEAQSKIEEELKQKEIKEK